jgi:hypothetical protein
MNNGSRAKDKAEAYTKKDAHIIMMQTSSL